MKSRHEIILLGGTVFYFNVGIFAYVKINNYLIKIVYTKLI